MTAIKITEMHLCEQGKRNYYIFQYRKSLTVVALYTLRLGYHPEAYF